MTASGADVDTAIASANAATIQPESRSGSGHTSQAKPAPAELFELGRRHHAEGRYDIAEGLYRKVVDAIPQHWPARFELGVLCYLQGRLDEAITHVRQAVALEPNFARAQTALGTFLGMAGRAQEAIAPLQRAVELEPRSAEAHYNLGKAWEDVQALTEAEHAYRQALQADPQYGLAYVNLGKLYNEQGRAQEGLALYREGLPHIDATRPELHSNLPMLTNFIADLPDSEVRQAHRAFDQRFVRPLAQEILPPANTRLPHRRLRIGYLSRDLRRHSVRYFLLPILEHHDHAAYEIVCYFDGERADDVTELFKAQSDVWVQSRGLSDSELAARIRHDRIDILIDLGGHTDRNRLLVFARRPAPVQITYLGYPSTTGVSTLDYRISDRWIDPAPPAAAIPTSEAPLRLQHGYFCYAPLPESPEVSPLPLDRHGAVTFGSLSQGAKLNQRLFACWSAILQRVPDARLWIQYSALHHTGTREWLMAEFERRGVDPARLLLHPFAPAPAYLKSYHEIDIALDSFPYNGGTTTCEALWMGVPVVSLCGSRHVGRLGASILGQLGLEDLVATTPGEYIDKAITLAQDRDRLRTLRATLRERMLGSPLMDHAGFTRELEAGYREVWRRWCATRSNP